MSSNSARSVLRGEVRIFLNEDTEDFYLDTDLNTLLQRAYELYWREYVEANPEWAKRTEDITYTASAEYYDVTISGYTIETIDLVEDRTDVQPGITVKKAECKEDLIDTIREEDTTEDYELRYWFEKQTAITSGVHAITQRLYLGPTPNSSRSLRLHYQAGPQSLTADTYTTGLPDFVEPCIVLRTAKMALLKDRNSNPSLKQQIDLDLQEAEEKMRKRLRSFTRGESRIICVDDY